jgi:hypothetical protein
VIHSFFRLILAWLCLYSPDIGARYYYANSGPFSDEKIYVLDVKAGFVQYGVELPNGIRTVHWTAISTFALMCRKYEGSESNG